MLGLPIYVLVSIQYDPPFLCVLSLKTSSQSSGQSRRLSLLERRGKGQGMLLHSIRLELDLETLLDDHHMNVEQPFANGTF